MVPLYSCRCSLPNAGMWQLFTAKERKAYSRLDTVLYGRLVQNTWPLQILHANLTSESCQSRKKPECDAAGCFVSCTYNSHPSFTDNITTQILYILKIAAFLKFVIRLQTNSDRALMCVFFCLIRDRRLLSRSRMLLCFSSCSPGSAAALRSSTGSMICHQQFKWSSL